MKFRFLFIGILALCIDYVLLSHLSRNSTLTRDEFIARRNRILAQRRGRNNVQSDTLSPSGQLDTARSRQVQNSTNFNSINVSPNLFNRRRSNPNERGVNTRITTNVVTNRGSQRSGQRTREGQIPRTSRINLNGRGRSSENTLRGQTRRLNSRIQSSRQLRRGRLNPENLRRRQGRVRGNSDLRGIDSNSLDARIRDQEPSQGGNNVIGSGFDNSISRVILTPVQDGAVRSLRTLLNSGRGNATPRLIGFLIPRPDGRTQLRLMRGAQRFFSSRRRRSQESSDDGQNETTPGPLPINLRTILEAARRANLLPTRNGSRGDRNRNPPIVVLRSPNRNEAGISDDTPSPPRFGRRRGPLRRTGPGGDRSEGTTNIDQRRVNIEVNVDNQGGDDGTTQTQPRRQRQRQRQIQRQRQQGVFMRRRPQLPRNTFDSVTQSPAFSGTNSNTRPLFPSSSRRNTGIGLGMGLPTPPRRAFQNTFGQIDRSFDRVPSVDSVNSVPIGETGRNPPNPFGGRNEPRRVGVAGTRRQGGGVEIPNFAGSFSNNVDSDVGRTNVNTIDNFRTDNIPGQTNNLLPNFSASVDSFNLQRRTNPVDSQIPQRGRASSRSRRPQTRVFQPQAVINDGNIARDFNTLPPRSDQPMVPVDSFNQVQRQPQIMNLPSNSMVVPTSAPSLDVNNFRVPTSAPSLDASNFRRNESPVSSQQIEALRPQPVVQTTRVVESNRVNNPSFIQPALLPEFPNPSTPSFPQGGIPGQDNIIRPLTGINDPPRVPPFIQPVTDQTGAPTILNSQTSSVVEVPNLPGLMSTGNSFQIQPERRISGQISVDASPLNFTFDTNSLTPVNITNQIPLTNVSLLSDTNILPIDALFASNTASLPKISAMDTSFNNVSLDAGTQNALIRQQIVAAGGVPFNELPLGSVNDVNNVQGIPVDQQVQSLPESINVASSNNLVPSQINDPAPIIIETTPKVQIVTDAAISPTVVATVKVPALQTPDQLALVSMKPNPAVPDVKANITSTVKKTQIPADVIPTGPPPPLIQSIGVDNSQVPLPALLEQNPLLNSNVQSFDVPQLTQTGAQNLPQPLLPLDTRQMFIDAQIQNIPPNNIAQQVGMERTGLFPSNSQNIQIPSQFLDQQSFGNVRQPAVGFPVKLGNKMNVLNTFTQVMMNNLRNRNNQRSGQSKPVQSNRPRSGVPLDMGALRNLINDVLKTFFMNNNMDLRTMSQRGPGSAIDMVEKVVVDAATAHIGAVGAQKAIVEQNIKATVKNTLNELASLSSAPSQNIPAPVPTSGPVQDTISQGIAVARSSSQIESLNQNITPPNFQWSNFNNPDPIVSSSSSNTSTSDLKVGKKGISVFPTVPGKINMSLTVQMPEIPIQSVSNTTVQIIDKSPGIVIDAVPVTPAAPVSTITTTTQTVPISTASLETVSTTSLTTPSTISVTSTLPLSTSTSTITSTSQSTPQSTPQSTIVTELTAATTEVLPTSTSSIAPIVVVSASLGTEVVPPNPIPLQNTTPPKQSFSDDSSSSASKSTNTSSIPVDVTLSNATSKIIPAPPATLRNPWLSRFPRHLNVSLAYRMPKRGGKVRISHNVVNQAVVIKSLPPGASGTSLAADVTFRNLPTDTATQFGAGIEQKVTLAQNMKPPYAIPNLKAHAQRFGLVGHGGDLVRSADVGKPGGLPVFLPGSV
uniref:Larval shell matrix protein 5 n=1 Tax=Pinctada fucata TaxID=50426 RepID=A0A3G2LJ56_PINFU|nr:larval shell matrix protein 5 [Pinctada fucata]